MSRMLTSCMLGDYLNTRGARSAAGLRMICGPAATDAFPLRHAVPDDRCLNNERLNTSISLKIILVLYLIIYPYSFLHVTYFDNVLFVNLIIELSYIWYLYPRAKPGAARCTVSRFYLILLHHVCN